MSPARQRQRLTRAAALAAAVAALVNAGPALADEVFGGVYAHEVDTPFTLKTYEDGTDIQIGYRTDPIEALGVIGKPAAHVFVSANTAGDTSFAAAGLDWTVRMGRTFYVRPGIGLAVHDAPSFRLNPEGTRRTDFGSRVLFEPELAIGAQLTPKLSLEASWVHISNGRIFNGHQNPGLDTIGVRANLKL